MILNVPIVRQEKYSVDCGLASLSMLFKYYGIEKYIYVNYPMWDKRGGRHKHLHEDFICGIYASAYGDLDNASIIKIKKR
jgi:hypothetical protein